MRAFVIIVLSILLTLVLTPTAGRGDQVSECEKTLSLCVRANDAHQAARKADAAIIEKLTKQRDEATEAAAKAASSLSPTVYILIGVLVGGLTVGITR